MIEKEDFDVDLVYLWVDGNDPEWQARRNASIGLPSNNSAVNCEGRFADNDELKYSLRSVEQYMPWIRRIFIVTDRQVPRWLDLSNPRVRIVDHSEILPSRSLPCFNPNVLEHFIHRIPGLAEHYLFANDDMMINRPLTRADFYDPKDGLPIFRLRRRPMRKMEIFIREKIRRKPLLNFNRTVLNSALLVEKKYGRFYGAAGHHNIDAYLKSDCNHVADVFAGELSLRFENHMRAENDLQRMLYPYALMAGKRVHPAYVTDRESFLLEIYKPHHYERLLRCNPLFFCMNDSQYATAADRRRSTSFLQTRFPNPSPLEK